MYNSRKLQQRLAVAGGVILGTPHTSAKAQLVRNPGTQRILPCSWDDCTNHGDNRIQVRIPHEKPRWRDPVTGNQEMLIHIFCSDQHKQHYINAHRKQ